MGLLASFLWLSVFAAASPCVDERILVEDYAFDAGQRERLWRRHLGCGGRIQDPFLPRSDGGAEALKRFQSGEALSWSVPARFVSQVLSDIQAVVDGGHAERLFVIDFNHGHVYLDEAVIASRYRGFSEAALAEAALSDPDAVLVYHSQEMWNQWRHPREFHSVSGVLAAREYAPPGARHLFHVRFRAHPAGAYALRDGTRFDLSFQEESWDEAAERLGFRVTY